MAFLQIATGVGKELDGRETQGCRYGKVSMCRGVVPVNTGVLYEEKDRRLRPNVQGTPMEKRAFRRRGRGLTDAARLQGKTLQGKTLQGHESRFLISDTIRAL